METYKLLKPPLKVNVSRIFKFQRGLLLPLLHKPFFPPLCLSTSCLSKAVYWSFLFLFHNLLPIRPIQDIQWLVPLLSMDDTI